MNFLKTFLPVVLAVGLSSTFTFAGEQETSRSGDEINERDFDALRDFLKAKRGDALKEAEEAGTNVAISGDVRTEWRHMTETANGKRQRGPGARDIKNEIQVIGGAYVENRTIGLPISRNDFDVEFNLYLDYETKRSWAAVQVQFDNSMGVDDNGIRCLLDPQGYHGSGYCDGLCLKNAYWGYQVWDNQCNEFYVEVGRRSNLYKVFDSKIQFLSRFDGILLHYAYKWPEMFDWYLKGAAFVIDERTNSFGYVAETGFLNIAESNVDLKYSFIYWKQGGKNRCREKDPQGFDFMNSQLTFAYHFDPEILGKKATAYAAVLYNHADRDAYNPVVYLVDDPESEDQISIFEYKKFDKNQRLGWYVGFIIGKPEKEGDWSFEMMYQVIQAFAMPDNDMAGIGRGNVQHESLTSLKSRGNTNFRGWKFEGLYALTNELVIDSIIEFSIADNRKIGKEHSYSKCELEVVYSF
jgi:hypothetical protein